MNIPVNSNEALKFARQAAGLDECTEVYESSEHFVDIVARCRYALVKSFECLGWDFRYAVGVAVKAQTDGAITNTAYAIISSIQAERDRARREAESLVETLQSEMRTVNWRPSDGVAC